MPKYSTNFYQRYHQSHSERDFLGVFSRLAITGDRTKKLLGIDFHRTDFLGGHFILRFTILNSKFEFWRINPKSSNQFPPQSKESIQSPIAISLAAELYQKEPSISKWLKWRYHTIKHSLHRALLPPKVQYSTLYENYGEHEIECSLYSSSKWLLFIRNRYLIKLAMDLQLLKGREQAKAKQAEIQRPINSFNLTVINEEDDFNQLGQFDVVQFDAEKDLELHLARRQKKITSPVEQLEVEESADIHSPP